MKDDRSKKYPKKFVTTRSEYVWNGERYVEVHKEGYWYEGPWALAHTNANFVQQNWRFRNDNGTLSTATFAVAENTAANNDEFSAGDKFRVRFNLGDDAAADANNSGSPTLQYRVNTGGGFGSWTNVPTTATGDGIAFASSDNSITDGANDSTQRLSTISGTNYNGTFNEYDDNGSQSSQTYSDQYAEFEYCLELSSGTGGNVYEFRLLDPTGNVPDTPPSADASLTVAAGAKTASGTPSLASPTSSGTAKMQPIASGTAALVAIAAAGVVTLAPKVHLNTTETLSGATAMTVTSWNAAGTQVTFTDPVGSPTGSLKLGVESRQNGGGDGNTAWIDVTVVLGADGSATLVSPTSSGTATAGTAAKTASGTPSLVSPTSAGTAKQVLKPSGAAAVGTITSSGSAKQVLKPSGSAQLDALTSSGSASQILKPSGAASVGPVTSSGVATNNLIASGEASMTALTSSGTASQILKPSGTASLDQVASSGSASQILKPSGTASLQQPTSSGVASQILKPSGAASVGPVTSSGTATKETGTKEASGTPALQQLTSSGSASQILKPSGTASLVALTASGGATTALPAIGNAALAAITASGVTNLAPKVHLNSSQTVVGATELQVTSFTADGLTVTFTDPKGLPVGDGLWLGVETRGVSAGTPELRDANTAWIAVTVEGAAGSATLEAITASGQVTNTTPVTLTTTGTPSIQAITSSGVVNNFADAEAFPVLEVITASGTADASPSPKSASGTPTLETLTSSGAASQILKPSGSATIGAITSSGVAGIAGDKPASGSATLEAITASGTAIGPAPVVGGGGGGSMGPRRPVPSKYFKRPLDKLSLRTQPLKDEELEEKIEEIVDEVIDEVESVEAQSEEIRVPGQDIAALAAKRALAQQNVIRTARKAEKVSQKVAEAQIRARINELVRRQREFFETDNEDIQAILFILSELV